MADTDVEVRVSKPFDRHDGANGSSANGEAADTRSGSKTVDLADRRRHPRYRFSEPMRVCLQGGASLEGMSVEISQSGMSAMIQGPLKPGDIVRLQPLTGVTIAAIVRHKLGMLYGFEFLELAREQATKIAERCRKCKPWRSNARAV